MVSLSDLVFGTQKIPVHPPFLTFLLPFVRSGFSHNLRSISQISFRFTMASLLTMSSATLAGSMNTKISSKVGPARLAAPLASKRYVVTTLESGIFVWNVVCALVLPRVNIAASALDYIETLIDASVFACVASRSRLRCSFLGSLMRCDLRRPNFSQAQPLHQGRAALPPHRLCL